MCPNFNTGDMWLAMSQIREHIAKQADGFRARACECCRPVNGAVFAIMQDLKALSLSSNDLYHDYGN